jgi:CheY-like chemotaxis protein
LDAVFVDWEMPNMDGWQLIRNLRKLYAGQPCPRMVLISGRGRHGLGERTEREQSLLDGFVTKPLTAEMVRAAVRAVGAGDGEATGGSAAVHDRRLQGMRILLVEDNPINQQVARELLVAEGAEVEIADNGQMGVDILSRRSSEFDVVLMDLQMPVMDGLTAARTIRGELALAALPVIAMTANAMASDREDCLDAGMNDHVGKPFDLDQLVAVLLRHTQRKAPPAAGSPVQSATRAESAKHAAVPPTDAPAGIEFAAALSRMGGNADLLRRTMQAFIADAPQLVQRVAGLLEARDRAGAKRELHAFKGLCGTLGMVAMAATAARAEQLVAQEGPSQPLQQILADMTGELVELLPQLAAMAEQLTPPGSQSRQGGATDVGAAVEMGPAVRESLLALQQALLESDMGALELHARIRLQVPEPLLSAMEALDAAMAELEFEAAAEACSKLLAQPGP